MTTDQSEPGAVAPMKTYPPTLNSRAVLTVPRDVLSAALAAPEIAAERLAMYLAGFKSAGYYTPPMAQPERQARIVIYHKAVAGIPEPFTAGAFEDWFARMPRAPSAGEVAMEARQLFRDATRRHAELSPFNREPNRLPEPTEADIQRRREFVAKIAETEPDLLWFQYRGMKT